MLAIDHGLVEELEDQTYTCHHPKRARAHVRTFDITRHPTDIEGFYQQRVSRADSHQLHNQGRGTAVLAHLASSSLGARKELT
jgi:hypothetical protein